jgi:hypothetical protein
MQLSTGKGPPVSFSVASSIVQLAGRKSTLSVKKPLGPDQVKISVPTIVTVARPSDACPTMTSLPFDPISARSTVIAARTGVDPTIRAPARPAAAIFA